jgi:hypothetical protein
VTSFALETRRTDAQKVVPGDGTVAAVDARVVKARVVGYDTFQHVIAFDSAERLGNVVVANLQREDFNDPGDVTAPDLQIAAIFGLPVIS